MKRSNDSQSTGTPRSVFQDGSGRLPMLVADRRQRAAFRAIPTAADHPKRKNRATGRPRRRRSQVAAAATRCVVSGGEVR